MTNALVVPETVQLFLSNLPFFGFGFEWHLGRGAGCDGGISNLPFFGFGFGFEVNPGADPADGRFEAVVIEARSRRALLAKLVRLLRLTSPTRCLTTWTRSCSSMTAPRPRSPTASAA